MKAIGIDIGTTSICGVVLDAENGNVLTSRTVNSDAFISTPNDWEKIQDVTKIVAIGDNQASVFSTLADNRDLLINVGTGSQISIVSDYSFACSD